MLKILGYFQSNMEIYMNQIICSGCSRLLSRIFNTIFIRFSVSTDLIAAIAQTRAPSGPESHLRMMFIKESKALHGKCAIHYVDKTGYLRSRATFGLGQTWERFQGSFRQGSIKFKDNSRTNSYFSRHFLITILTHNM